MSASNASKLLDTLNKKYLTLHKKYEEYFWISYMGDHSVDEKYTEANAKREAFRSNAKLLKQVKEAIKEAKGKEKKRLEYWENFFELYQSPDHLKELYKQIMELEAKMQKRRGTREEGYIDPKTKKFVKASENQMRSMMVTEESEKLRKACFESMEEMATDLLDDYVTLINLRNEYARGLGYEDFYDFKIQSEEGMTKNELFDLFDTIYEKTKHGFENLREMEKEMKGLRKPWNRGYMLAGDFSREDDPYYPFDEALIRWGRSFAAMGIDFQGGTLQLDLLERKGKYNNGFCHWPDLVHFKDGKRKPGSANFTCTVVYGEIGEGESGYHTLFHEGGHAAHYLNSEMEDVCLNNEYPPASTAWAETHSMFIDSMYSSLEWTMRYAKDKNGNAYPYSNFEKQVKKLFPLRPLGLMGIMSVCDLERELYSAKDLTPEKIQSIAKSVHKKYTDSAVPSMRLLNVPHLYAWSSACSYQGYGLATLALTQWRKYFYDKYEYIVDNPKVVKEMKKVWKLGSSKTFKECVKIATGEDLSAKAYLKNANMSEKQVFSRAKKRLERMESVKEYTKPVDLGAIIRMVHGKEVIADNKKSFENMAEKYAEWLETQKIKK